MYFTIEFLYHSSNILIFKIYISSTDSISESTRRSFSAEGMKLTTTKTNSYYTQKNQVTRFESYFGPDQTYITTKDYIARGHLVPDADNIMGYSQLATYYYANVAPEYQTVNAGNWLRVEELARSMASSYGDDLESYNGYLGILQLPNSNGDLIDIYLDDEGQFPVPKYFFKVLLHKPTDEGIVFLSVNNPFETDGAAMEICENVCSATNWTHINFPDTTKGYTFCCRVEDFLKLYDGLPSDVTASKFMTG